MSFPAFYKYSFQPNAFQTTNEVSIASGVPIARSGDKIGHGAAIIAGKAKKVFSDGLLVAVLGDIIVPHFNYSIHIAVISSGSTKVYANGIPLARIGDSTSCGSTVVTGSTKVLSA